ncbi:ligand-dependent nuclear receptor-interacting factor 1 isoform X2 [Pogoniulus pusillus]|uniref:ligand-dependent nuclear receptor-interacting factor 1 isoform X2 n=1 Tax=Pogoniulus pusillus TaxID=488313 RepID=UPI0030B942C5
MSSPEERSGSATQFVAGCMYRVVPTTAPDGKNLLKLLPVSESPGSFVPTVQSSAMANHSKANISGPLHLPFNAQLASPAAPSPAEAPALQSPNPAKIVLTATLDKEQSVRAGSEKESSVPKAAADSPGSCLSVEVVSVRSSSEQGSTAYMFVNTRNLPVTVKSPALPYGHHLQIPANAEVKSVPASSLPLSVQQKILETAASNAAGGAGDSQVPTVIYVSPVNTVKTAVPKCLRALCSEQASQASKTLLMTPAQKEKSCAKAVPAEGQQCQQVPMKWIVQENPQAPALTPVKSSNSVASKILKTLLDMKNIEMSSANIVPLCSSGSQTKIMTTKENALVMCNGKVYLLARRGSDLSAQADKQASASADALPEKDAAKLIDCADRMVNLLLCKSKGMLPPQKEPHSKAPSPAVFTSDLNSAPAVAVVPGAKQSSTANQRESLPLPEGISSGVSSVPAAGTQEDICRNGKERSPSPTAASAVLPQPEPEGALAEGCHKIHCVKMESPKKVTPSELQEKPHWKQYLELRRKFGLLKEEKVYLWRIPLPPSWKEPEEDCSSNSLSTGTDSCSSLSVDVETPNQQQECVREEKIKVELEEDFSRKRKIKSSPVSEGGKRRRRSSQSSTSPSSSSEHTNSAASVLSICVPPAPVLPQLSLSTAPLVPSPGRDSDQDAEALYGDSTDSQTPVVLSGESYSSLLEGSFRDDAFPWTPPDVDETIRDEKIKRLKQLLREREAALEEVRRKMQQS